MATTVSAKSSATGLSRGVTSSGSTCAALDALWRPYLTSRPTVGFSPVWSGPKLRCCGGAVCDYMRAVGIARPLVEGQAGVISRVVEHGVSFAGGSH